MAYMYTKDNLLDDLKAIKSDIRAKELKPFYFLYGNEDYFIDEIVKSIKKTFDDATGLNFKRFIEETFDIDEVIKYINTIPLMNDKKLIVFEDISFFNNPKKMDLSELIKSFDDNKNNNVIIIVEHNSRDKDEKYQKYYNNSNEIAKYFKENGVLIDLHKLNEEQLNKHIVNKFAKSKKIIDKVEAAYIIRSAGKNLKNLYNECDKIISYVGEKENVERTDIDAIITQSIDENVFNLINMVNNNKLNDAISLYGGLISEGETSRNVFYRFVNNYKNLIVSKSYIEKNKGQNEIAKLMHIETWQVNRLMEACKYVSKDTLSSKVRKATEISLKSMKSEVDEDMLAEMLFLS